LWNVRENQWLAINESIQKVFLQSRKVIGDILTFSKPEGVLTMGQDNWNDLTVIV